MPDTEKITINLSAVDLGKIDLLVQQGLYNNRTDFIRTAIRSQTERHSFEIQQAVTFHAFVVGVLTYTQADLETYQQRNQKLVIKVVGMLQLAEDILPEVATEVIQSIQCHGIFQASPAVKSALESRIK